MLAAKILKQIFIIPALLGAGMFFSCVNDPKDVAKITAGTDVPQESMEVVTLIYNDSGYTKAILETPLINKYYGEKERMEFPKGLKVVFYKPGMLRESQLTSNYGVLNQGTRKLIVRNNVVFINFIRQDTLNTELLNWSQDSARIYTDKSVILKNPSGVFRSEGFLASETFSWYEFTKPKGTYYYTETDSIQEEQ